ncbi:hydrogenase maturation protease [Kitasatospora sp. NPDC048540]|uniref:hydrogenase maturation protease n=1 Tax=Kitasatospora sp. NPDC048540 TaxID=3155634 RepID=UPI0033E483C7
MSAAVPKGRVLVAGVGNIFLGDDGFGVEVVRRLSALALPDHVELVDTGVRGVHLAYQLLEGYRTVVLVDATARGCEPGTVYLIEARLPEPEERPAVMDGHRMTPDAVLAVLGTLTSGLGRSGPEKVLVVGCEPQSLDEGMGLSPVVEASVDEAVHVVLGLVEEAGRTAAALGTR